VVNQGTKVDLAMKTAPVCGKVLSVLMGDAVPVEIQKNPAVRGTRAGIVVSVVRAVFVNFAVVLTNHAVKAIPVMMIITSAARTDGVNCVAEVKSLAARGTFAMEVSMSVGQMVFAMDAAMRMNPVVMEIVAMSGISVVPMGFATDVVGLVSLVVKPTVVKNGHFVDQIKFVKHVGVMESHVARGISVNVTTDAALITSARPVEDMISLVVKVMYAENGMSVMRKGSVNHVARFIHAQGIAVKRIIITMTRMANATSMAM
jgi:hypothetical protein